MGIQNLHYMFKDSAMVEEILQFGTTGKNLTEKEAMWKFYQYLAFPLQGVCKCVKIFLNLDCDFIFRVLKRIGGHWITRQVDGDKFICMDRLINNGSCLVYSFGVNKDWTFEDVMDDLGCEVHAHDHTVEYPATRGNNTHFYKLGLGTQENMDTLANIINKNGHKDTIIEYLKVNTNHLPVWEAAMTVMQTKQATFE